MSMMRLTKTSSALTGSTIAVAMAALMLSGVASAADGPRGGRAERMGERMAERIKDRCDDMRERLEKLDRNLTSDQLRDIIQGRLASLNGGNLKVGKATKKGDDVVTLEIVTKSGALVNVRDFSTKTGMPVGAGERCDQVAERISKAVANRGDGPGPGGRGPGGRGPGGPEMGRLAALGLIADAGPDRDLNLTKDQARKLAEAALIVVGNPRLKVGDIREKDPGTYEIDIVAADNSLVFHRELDRHSGRSNRD